MDTHVRGGACTVHSSGESGVPLSPVALLRCLMFQMQSSFTSSEQELERLRRENQDMESVCYLIVIVVTCEPIFIILDCPTICFKATFISNDIIMFLFFWIVWVNTVLNSWVSLLPIMGKTTEGKCDDFLVLCDSWEENENTWRWSWRRQRLNGQLMWQKSERYVWQKFFKIAFQFKLSRDRVFYFRLSCVWKSFQVATKYGSSWRSILNFKLHCSWKICWLSCRESLMTHILKQ